MAKLSPLFLDFAMKNYEKLMRCEKCDYEYVDMRRQSTHESHVENVDIETKSIKPRWKTFHFILRKRIHSRFYLS